MSERRDVDRPQLRQGENVGSQGEADVRVGELCAQPLQSRSDDLSVVEGRGREGAGGMPGGVRRHLRIEIGGNEPEIGGRELPVARISSRFASGLQLLQMGELPDVYLRGEVAADRRLERLSALEVAARQRPA